METQDLKRLIISFSAKCALKCPYCYAPFNGVAPSSRVLSDILLFAKTERINILTFGGGDPFQYMLIRSILKEAKAMGFFVHVDTHGIGIRDADYEVIAEVVDLMGLPLEGPKEIHDSMRQRPGHYEHVIQILNRLLHQGSRVKINTMVSAINANSIVSLVDGISASLPAIWSFYQFMEVPFKTEANTKYAISSDEVETMVCKLRNKHPQIAFETGTSDRRRTGYLFVQTDGELFTHSPTGVGYLKLGSIYSKEWRANFYTMHQTMLPELSVARYSF